MTYEYRIMSYHKRRSPHEGLQLLGIVEEDLPVSPNHDTISGKKCHYSSFVTIKIYRKLTKISPGADIFQSPFLRGFLLEGLIFGGKFAFQNRLG